ncbi:hypothetical protein VB620_05650 [Nodularia harveyana UHCC-0300]|uniref:Uncharacterized protein n=1 Tax=Nodularia harveyana UHCC-0300 TaxID=2974287 RepID=A0ABU5UCE8_9CYAN|nr:hypothetical protein [Nodularia harveyana]MEA5580824.1 hypothetical protein [Nodularia harveyana UHCC-0300]
MKHPFDLEITELESLNLEFQEVTDKDAAEITGGANFTTLAIGEEGGGLNNLPSLSPLPSFPIGGNGGVATTLAIGEEGGVATTLAIGEEGGVATTLAIGEEGGVATTLAIGEEGGDVNFPI